MQNSLKNIFQLVVIFSVMTITGSVGLLLRILSFGTLIEFNRRFFIAKSSAFTMKLVGIKLDLPKEFKLPSKPAFVTFNHNSYLDIFGLTAMGIPNIRFMLSEKTIKIIPLTLSAMAIGVAYIPQKKHPGRRRQFFLKIEEKIMKEQFHIAGSSEGVHEHHHGIDEFNKGVYHMATICKLDIFPLFIYVPKESNPFSKYTYFKKGTLKIEPMETVITGHWTINDLETNKEWMRTQYVKKFNFYNNTQLT